MMLVTDWEWESYKSSMFIWTFFFRRLFLRTIYTRELLNQSFTTTVAISSQFNLKICQSESVTVYYKEASAAIVQDGTYPKLDLKSRVVSFMHLQLLSS